MLNIVSIKARDLPDLWFQAVANILDHGRRFQIDRGSYAGQTRLEYDFFSGHVTYPGTQPMLPDIPPACGIPNPVEHEYIYGGEGYPRSYLEYLMTPHKEPGESYTYGERLTHVPLSGEKLAWWESQNTEIVDIRPVDGRVVFEEEGRLYLNQIEWVIQTYKQFGARNNQMVLQVAHPSDLTLRRPPLPACHRHPHSGRHPSLFRLFPILGSVGRFSRQPGRHSEPERIHGRRDRRQRRRDGGGEQGPPSLRLRRGSGQTALYAIKIRRREDVIPSLLLIFNWL